MQQRLETIIRVGKAMREAQKAYFKYRDQAVTRERERLEKEFDSLLHDTPKERQGSLV